MTTAALKTRRRTQTIASPAHADRRTTALTVIVPAFNEAACIAETIASLQAQTAPPAAIIVVDDGSTDGTAAAVQAAFGREPRVRLLRQANAGKASALNRAIGAARGEVLVAFDADTMVAPDAVRSLVRHFEDPRVAAVAGPDTALLVMGLAFLFGGLKNGPQRFGSEKPRAIVILMVLAVSALVVPTLADAIHTPAEFHEETLSIASALVLLAVFAASVPFSWRGGAIGETVPAAELEEKPWSLRRAISVLVVAGIVTAFVSDWFVQALEPTIESWHISQAFAGLVLVAIAGNAVENVVGIRLAIKNKPDYAISVVMNSSLRAMPLARMPSRTCSSVPYLRAVSMCR